MEKKLTAKRTRRCKPREAPKNVKDGSAWVRKYLIDLYDRENGAAANWQLIAETAFKVGLDAIDCAPHGLRRVETLNRFHEAAYDRLAGNVLPDDALMSPTDPLPKVRRVDLDSNMRPGRFE